MNASVEIYIVMGYC